jgi:hypothetical protein
MAINYRENGETATSETLLAIKAVKADLPQRMRRDAEESFNLGGKNGFCKSDES